MSDSQNDCLWTPSEEDIKNSNLFHYMEYVKKNSYQELYYQGCKTSSKFNNNEKAISFYKYSKKISKESISNFIDKTDIKIELLSDYLYKTQKNKIYLLYNNGQFILQKIDINDYKINIINKNPNKSRYECISENGKSINILLRWKNGNGIAFPSFQIS